MTSLRSKTGGGNEIGQIIEREVKCLTIPRRMISVWVQVPWVVLGEG
jgi:hypothetical protein